MENKIVRLLEEIKIPFSRAQYSGKSEEYIVWNINSTIFPIYKSNHASEIIEYITINIYSKKDYDHIKNSLIEKINQSENFVLLDIEREDYEENTGYYHRPINIAYI